jgi:prefoldin subunit 5
MTDENQDYEDEFDALTNGDDHAEEVQEAEEEVGDDGSLEGGEIADEGESEAQEPDELTKYKAEVDQWKHRYNSDIGRVNAYQRQVEALKAQLAQVEAQKKATSSDKKPEGSELTDSEWQTLKEDFPEIAVALEKRLNSVASNYEAKTLSYEQKIKQLEQQMQPIQQQAHDQFKQSQYAVLEQQHPDWRDVAQSQEFQQWLQQQPPAVQQLTESDSAADAAFLVGSYKAVSSVDTSAIRQRRATTLRQSQTIPTKGVKRNNGAPGDFESAFDYYAAKG